MTPCADPQITHEFPIARLHIGRSQKCKSVACLFCEKGTMLETPDVDGSLATLTEPRQFVLDEKMQFLKSNGLEKQSFLEN